MTVKPGWARKRDRLRCREPEPHSAQGQGPNTSGAAALAGPPAAPVVRHRSRAMKIITPLILFGLGMVLLVLAVVLYPSATAEIAGPPVPILRISSPVPILSISYRVIQTSSDRTDVEVVIVRDPLVPMSRFRTARLQVVSVNLDTFSGNGPTGFANFGRIRSTVATFNFTVHWADFGMRFDGITASAAIPALSYTGPGTPSVAVEYPIPSASSYDWSSFPTTELDSSSAVWMVAATRSDAGGEAGAFTPGQVAIGINHARQATDNNKTFLAGALLGLAGGAILSAIQEALHARD